MIKFYLICFIVFYFFYFSFVSEGEISTRAEGGGW